MTSGRIRFEAHTGLLLSQSEGEAFGREGLLPFRPLGSRTESILMAILISLSPEEGLIADYVIHSAMTYLGGLLLGSDLVSQSSLLITTLYPNLNPVNLVLTMSG